MNINELNILNNCEYHYVYQYGIAVTLTRRPMMIIYKY